MSGALSVAREGRVPLLVLLAVFARAYVDVAAKIALDRAVAVFGPGDSDATALVSRVAESNETTRRDNLIYALLCAQKDRYKAPASKSAT